MVTGVGTRQFAAGGIPRASFILCFSFFDMKHLLDIKPEGGTYIYSACEAFNEGVRSTL
jgi:hypothetical protein